MLEYLSLQRERERERERFEPVREREGVWLTPGNIILLTASSNSALKLGGLDLLVRRSMFCSKRVMAG